ncbi:D-alanyl-D-alanine carboxypeptidase family protein [uncultured Dysosmobacter sp.]|uniref:D-alanyl-D-alanine carboxypeptidase family protein n=1 Tax=uncultured Dysosmobacter sp. TaxID=2591384 RepID=UPI0026024A1A|nr:D-alanyl-D-alanine carboxypeptidase family protein [uncultured Dysosmobacter sp.]
MAVVLQYPRIEAPEREYYVARRPAPSARRAQRHRRHFLLFPALLALLLFGGGFLLGKASAAPEPPSGGAGGIPAASLSPAEPDSITPEKPTAKGSASAAPGSSSAGADGIPAASLSPAEPDSIVPEKPTAKGTASAAPGSSSDGTGGIPAASLSPAEPDSIVPEKPTAADVASTASSTDWALLLVNGEHPLPEDFTIPELTQLKNGHAIDSRAYPSLQAMMDAARAEGLQPLICSSYRTWDKQTKLFEAKTQFYMNQGYVRTEAEERAAQWVARPGTSEHQMCLAVDIVDMSYQLLDEAQEETAVQKWLMAHCAEYGFILRYPTEKSTLTGVNYEPWHYRYVGQEAAQEIMEQGICLEEYLAASR